MTLTHESFTFHFPDDFDDRSAVEMTDKGYLAGGSVELPGGQRFPVAFFTPTRLRQELELAVSDGCPVMTEPGLVVLPAITQDAIRCAIPELVRQRFFDHLQPLASVGANGAAR